MIYRNKNAWFVGREYKRARRGKPKKLILNIIEWLLVPTIILGIAALIALAM
jgi:hypothetical protein